MPNNTKKTSKPVAALAGKTLSNPNASARDRALAASALSQRNAGRQTGERMEARAGKALESERTTAKSRKLAASVVSQSNKKR